MGRYIVCQLDIRQEKPTISHRTYGRSRAGRNLKGTSRLSKNEKIDDAYPDELWKYMSSTEKAKYLVADVFSRGTQKKAYLKTEDRKQQDDSNEH